MIDIKLIRENADLVKNVADSVESEKAIKLIVDNAKIKNVENKIEEKEIKKDNKKEEKKDSKKTSKK